MGRRAHPYDQNAWEYGQSSKTIVPSIKHPSLTAHLSLQKTDPALKMAIEMAHVHNLILRGLNSIYQQAPHVRDTKDAQDLFIFCRAWIMTVKHHHGTEEAQLFPGLAALTGDATICQTEMEQYKLLHENLAKFEKYVTETKPEAYRWEDLKAVMDALTSILQPHLNNEIQTMLALERIEDKARLWEVWQNVEEAAKDFSLPNLFVSRLL